MKKLKCLTQLKGRDRHYFTSTVDEKTKGMPLSVDRQVPRRLGGDENEIRRLRGSHDQTCQQSHSIVLWSLALQSLAKTTELYLGS